MLANLSSAQIAGGVLIGSACAILMLCGGRVAGISGIVSGITLAPHAGERLWRTLFVIGMILGGWAAIALMSDSLPPPEFRWPLPAYAAAGLVAGLGAGLANGCTSGHGICGTARLSPRSMAATLIYLAVGALVVILTNPV